MPPREPACWLDRHGSWARCHWPNRRSVSHCPHGGLIASCDPTPNCRTATSGGRLHGGDERFYPALSIFWKQHWSGGIDHRIHSVDLVRTVRRLLLGKDAAVDAAVDDGIADHPGEHRVGVVAEAGGT